MFDKSSILVIGFFIVVGLFWCGRGEIAGLLLIAVIWLFDCGRLKI
jgi:hypothetical protein